MEGYFFAAMVSGAVWAWAGWVIAGKQGRSKINGAIACFLLGPFGFLLIFFVLEDCRPKCRKCRGVIAADAETCPHCRADDPRNKSLNKTEKLRKTNPELFGKTPL